MTLRRRRFRRRGGYHHHDRRAGPVPDHRHTPHRAFSGRTRMAYDIAAYHRFLAARSSSSRPSTTADRAGATRRSSAGHRRDTLSATVEFAPWWRNLADRERDKMPATRLVLRRTQLRRIASTTTACAWALRTGATATERDGRDSAVADFVVDAVPHRPAVREQRRGSVVHDPGARRPQPTSSGLHLRHPAPAQGGRGHSDGRHAAGRGR